VSARYPQRRPITSTTWARWWKLAVRFTQPTASNAVFNAVYRWGWGTACDLPASRTTGEWQSWSVGTPQEMIDQMRKEPWWVGIEAIAPTLAYDFEVMGDSSRVDTIPAEVVGDVSVPALVLCSGASPEWMLDVGGQSQLADALPRPNGTVPWRARSTSWPRRCPC
jgi:hypothetical protein